MPDMSGHLTDLRADGHKARLYFGVFVGSVILTATVDSTPADQALSLPITLVSGSAADVYRGFQVRVYRPDGTTFKGVTNVRAAGTISSASLPIRELGQADIAIEAGDVVKVYNLPFLGDKLPSDDETFAPDGLTYTAQGGAIAPNTRSGGHRMGMVDSGQTYRTEVMAGSDSATLDPDSGGGGTHLWTLLTGTLAFAPGSSSADANPTLRASVGYGLARHTFTDSANSAAWSQFVCFQVYDANNPPKRVLDASMDGVEDSGWSAEFETDADSTLAELPDGTLGALFVRETINGVDTSYGASVSGLSHIKCLGFLTHDEGDLQSSIRRLRFRLQSPWQRLAGLPGFSKVITRAVSADWTTVEGLTVLLGIFHLLHYYGFFTELFDVVVDAAFLDKAYAQFFIQKQTADGQVKELAAGVDARVTNLRAGALALHTHPGYIPLTARAAVTKTLTIAERDCLKAGVVRDHWKTIETFEGRGLTAGSTDNSGLFSRYPGNTPGRGNVTVSADKKIWDDQDDANQRTGRLAAKEDGAYIDADGVQGRAVEWTPTLFGSYDVFDFYKEYAATSLNAASNRRGIDLSAMLYYLSRVSVRYQGGTARIEPTFLTATNAPAGATYVPTEGEVAPYTPVDDIPTPIALPTPRVFPPSSTPPSRLIVSDADHPAVALGSISSDGLTVTFEDRSTGLASGGATRCIGKPWANPYNYRHYYQLTDVGLFENTDLPTTGSAWTLLASNNTLFGNASPGAYGFCRHNLNGWIIVVQNPAIGISLNGGATWTHATCGVPGALKIKYMPHSPHALLAISDDDPTYFNGGSFRLYRSSDDGLTWTSAGILLPSGTVSETHQSYETADFHIPYKRTLGVFSDPSTDNADDSGLVLLVAQTPVGNGQVNITVNAGASWAAPASVAYPTATGAGNDTIRAYTYDGRAIAYAVVESDGSGGRLRTSADGGVTEDAPFGNVNTSAAGTVGVQGWSLNEDSLIWYTSQADVQISPGVYADPLQMTFNKGLSVITARPYDNVAGAEFCLFTEQ